ncbi:MAG: ArsR/SmtB family transcription factor [Phycisphaerae bacterium]
MSLSGDMTRVGDNVWKALADKTRRDILDLLAVAPRTTGDLVAHFGEHCRTNVMKHLDVLVAAKLVLIRKDNNDGRVRWNHLNPAPIQMIYDQWVCKHVRGLARAATRLKAHVEKSNTKQKPKEQKQEDAT